MSEQTKEKRVVGEGRRDRRKQSWKEEKRRKEKGREGGKGEREEGSRDGLYCLATTARLHVPLNEMEIKHEKYLQRNFGYVRLVVLMNQSYSRFKYSSGRAWWLVGGSSERSL